MARLVLVDTVVELPGLLPLHAWSAIMSSDLVLLGDPEHPFAVHLDMAELRHEVIDDTSQRRALSRADLLGGVTPEDKARAELVVERVRDEGEVVYLLGAEDGETFVRTLGMEAARAGLEVEVVYFGPQPPGTRLLGLVGVMARLRAPGGCPWDREQDHASLARYAVEEVYELLEAIESGDPTGIAEELGDVALQVVFHAQIGADAGTFTIDDVADGISAKLKRRHPHVFGDTSVADAAEVVANWDALKAQEKPERTGVFDGVTAAQPAVGYAEALQRRAAKAGFEWEDDQQPARQVAEELEEFLAAGDDAERERELGDLLLSAVGLARRHGIDPETALRASANRFRRRFEAMLEAGEAPAPDSNEAWRRRWAAVKAAEEGDQPLT